MFQNNQRQFYRELNLEGERCKEQKADVEKQKKFCNIQNQSVEQKDARQFRVLRSQIIPQGLTTHIRGYTKHSDHISIDVRMSKIWYMSKKS